MSVFHKMVSIKYYFHQEEFIFLVQAMSKTSSLVKGVMSLFVHLETVKCILTKLIKSNWCYQSGILILFSIADLVHFAIVLVCSSVVVPGTFWGLSSFLPIFGLFVDVFLFPAPPVCLHCNNPVWWVAGRLHGGSWLSCADCQPWEHYTVPGYLRH